MFDYVGRCSDGVFYWIVYYVSNGELTNIHIYRRAKINGSWRNERFLSGIDKVLALLNTLPVELREKVKNIIEMYRKNVKEVFKRVKQYINVVSREVYDNIEYAIDVIRSLKTIFNGLDMIFNEQTAKIKDKFLQEKIKKILNTIKYEALSMWNRELKKLEEKWELPSRNPHELLEDVEVALNEVLRKIKVEEREG